MAGVIKLRKLTEKSVFPEGTKHAGMTIGDMLVTNKTYLLYVYFFYDRLSFIDAVLHKLHIRPEHIIEKPGSKPELFEQYGKRNIGLSLSYKTKNISDKEDKNYAASAIIKKRNKKKAIGQKVASAKKDKFMYSKGAMQFRNHNA